MTDGLSFVIGGGGSGDVNGVAGADAREYPPRGSQGVPELKFWRGTVELRGKAEDANSSRY